MSVWQFLAPAIFVALAIGVIEVTAYNPLSTAMKREADARRGPRSSAPRGRSGAPAFGCANRASTVNRSFMRTPSDAKEDSFLHFQAFNFAPDGAFEQRVDAEKATLHDGYWELTGVTVVTPGFDTQTRICLSAGDQPHPDRGRPGLRGARNRVLLEARRPWPTRSSGPGLDATPYRLRYQQLIASPALLAAMVLVAACFSLRLFRMGGVQQMVYGGVAAGFVLYVVDQDRRRLGRRRGRQPRRRRMVAGYRRVFIWSLRASAPGGRLMAWPIARPDQGGRRGLALARVAMALAFWLARPCRSFRARERRPAPTRPQPRRPPEIPTSSISRPISSPTTRTTTRSRRSAASCFTTRIACCRPTRSSTTAPTSTSRPRDASSSPTRTAASPTLRDST